MDSFASSCENVPPHRNRTHWVEFLSVFCNWHLRRHWKKHQSWKGFFFVVRDEVSFLDHQFLVANPFHQLAHVLDDSFVDNHFHRYEASTSYPPAGYPYDFHARGYGAHPADEC